LTWRDEATNTGVSLTGNSPKLATSVRDGDPMLRAALDMKSAWRLTRHVCRPPFTFHLSNIYAGDRMERGTRT
jgi:hypothetical protein